MKTVGKRIVLLGLLLSLVTVLPSVAQRKNASYLKYFDKYHKLAVEQQRKYKIPASITLAQGVLESGAGQSSLARKSNNHFGIKCHSDWRGKRVYYDDDLKGECFRKYKSVEDSYEDHSRFLAYRSRYASLFDLKITDYKGWAKGLKRCGYATDRRYADRLIKIIEDYELYRYDQEKSRADKKRDKVTERLMKSGRTLYMNCGLLCVKAKAGDSFEQIGDDLGFRTRSLVSYNDAPDKHFPLKAGDIVYLEKKKKKADKPNYDYVVKTGDSMYSISQKFGIRLKNLYKLNDKKEDYAPQVGDILRLR